jgi:hypothetical protein
VSPETLEVDVVAQVLLFVSILQDFVRYKYRLQLLTAHFPSWENNKENTNNIVFKAPIDL